MKYRIQLDDECNFENRTIYINLIKDFLNSSVSAEEMQLAFFNQRDYDLHRELSTITEENFQITKQKTAFAKLHYELFFVCEEFDEEGETYEECNEEWFRETVLMLWNDYLEETNDNDS